MTKYRIIKLNDKYKEHPTERIEIEIADRKEREDLPGYFDSDIDFIADNNDAFTDLIGFVSTYETPTEKEYAFDVTLGGRFAP